MTRSIKVLKLQIKKLKLEKDRKPKQMLTLINMPCELGGRFILQMTEEYTKNDLVKVEEFIFKTLSITTKLYEEISWENL